MKKILFVLLTFLMAAGVQAQTKEEVENVLKEYTEMMQTKEWSKALDYTYPELFNVVPREQMEQAIETSFNSPMFEMEIKEFSPKGISDLYEEEEISYRFVDYDMAMSMKILVDNPNLSMDTFAGAMKGQFGEENVTVDGKTLNIKADSKMAVIKKKGDPQLYALDIKKELKSMMAGFMSETFISRAFE